MGRDLTPDPEVFTVALGSLGGTFEAAFCARPDVLTTDRVGNLLAYLPNPPNRGPVFLATAADASVDDMRTLLRRHPGLAAICVAARGETDLRERLSLLSFQEEEAFPVMAARLAFLPLDAALPAGLHISPVRDPAAYARLLAIQNAVLEGWEARAVVKGAPGIGGASATQHLLGHVGDTEIAAATITLGERVATLWGIATLPDFRGRGFGRAMTLAGCGVAKERGYDTVALFATASGYPLYRSLGFRDLGTTGLFVRPRSAPPV